MQKALYYNLCLADCMPFLHYTDTISIAVLRCKMKGLFVVMVLIAMLVSQGAAQNYTCKFRTTPLWVPSNTYISILRSSILWRTSAWLDSCTLIWLGNHTNQRWENNFLRYFGQSRAFISDNRCLKNWQVDFMYTLTERKMAGIHAWVSQGCQ